MDFYFNLIVNCFYSFRRMEQELRGEIALKAAH